VRLTDRSCIASGFGAPLPESFVKDALQALL
jgi:hypothetical protein